jgi:hypothetical protein
MVEPEILAYYERNDERHRLASGGRRIEFLRVWDLLERFLPSPPATVLDVGGGAGSLGGPDEDTTRFLADGQYRNPAGDVEAFTTSYFHRPEDLATEVTDAGLQLDEIVGANGIVKLLLPDLSERLDDDAQRESVTGLPRLLEAEPSLLGLSQNLVAIARVPR